MLYFKSLRSYHGIANSAQHLHRRQQFLSVQWFVSTWILKGIICCLVSGAGAGLIVSAVVTLTCWPHSVLCSSFRPRLYAAILMVVFVLKCPEIGQNQTTFNGTQTQRDTLLLIVKLPLQNLDWKESENYICNTSDLSGITTLNDSVKNKSQPKVPLDQIEPFVSRVESILLPSPASSPVQQHQPPTSSVLTSNF